MKNILFLTISIMAFAGGSTAVYAQGGRSIQPPDFCAAFPNDVNCGGDGKEDAPVDPLPSPAPVTNEPVQNEVVPAIEPTNPPAQPAVENTDETKPETTPDNNTPVEQVLEQTPETNEPINSTDENNENIVFIGLLKILTYIYLMITGLLFALFAVIGLITYFTRNNKDLGPIPAGFIKVPLICGGLVLLGLLALYILQIV
jgi:hypothetical protein